MYTRFLVLSQWLFCCRDVFRIIKVLLYSDNAIYTEWLIAIFFCQGRLTFVTFCSPQ